MGREAISIANKAGHDAWLETAEASAAGEIKPATAVSCISFDSTRFTSAVSDTASQTSSDDQRPHILQCLQDRNSDSDVSMEGSDVSIGGIKFARISEIQAQMHSLQQELESLTAPSVAAQTATSAAISSDKEPTSVFSKGTRRRVDSVDSNIAALGLSSRLSRSRSSPSSSRPRRPPRPPHALPGYQRAYALIIRLRGSSPAGSPPARIGSLSL